jgi:acyl-[acyl-carrier-protein]-phospholipid O-acyltransferase/long-chain-fatty-acid--[acyl-carrier-protein] ligase
LIQGGMAALGWAPRVQFLLMSVLVVGATIYVLRLLPREFVRLIVLGIVRTVYRIEVFHGDRMPKEGGVLLTPNHVSFVDVFILSAASPRPVRILMLRDYFELPLVGHVARMFDSVPISASRAKDAIRVAGAALEEGSVVCIFPEGQLSRSGMLNEVKSGFYLIARKGGSPILPVYMDGVWGSIFSCERNKFFWKRPRRIPYGMRVSFGEPLPAKGTNGLDLRHSLCALTGETIAKRSEATGSIPGLLSATKLGDPAAMWQEGGEWRHCSWQQVGDYVQGLREARELAGTHAGALAWVREWERLGALPFKEVKRLVVNALQLAEPGNLGLGHPVLVGSEANETVRRQWGMLLPALTRTRAVLLEEGDGLDEMRTLFLQEDVRDAVGGPKLKKQLQELGNLGRKVRLFRFDGVPQEEEEPQTWAGLCAGDLILSVSMPHTVQIRQLDQQQLLWEPGTFGRLLPGFAAKETDSGLEVLAVGGKETVVLPKVGMDGSGFVRGV